MELTRTALLDRLAAAINVLRRDSPTLVAIDGRSAAGKTTLADDLAERLLVESRLVLRSSIDDFHPPGHKFRSNGRARRAARRRLGRLGGGGGGALPHLLGADPHAL